MPMMTTYILNYGPIFVVLAASSQAVGAYESHNSQNLDFKNGHFNTLKNIFVYFSGQFSSFTCIKLHPLDWRLAAVLYSEMGKISFF